jgi:hypothetical protein
MIVIRDSPLCHKSLLFAVGPCPEARASSVADAGREGVTDAALRRDPGGAEGGARPQRKPDYCSVHENLPMLRHGHNHYKCKYIVDRHSHMNAASANI